MNSTNFDEPYISCSDDRDVSEETQNHTAVADINFNSSVDNDSELRTYIESANRGNIDSMAALAFIYYSGTSSICKNFQESYRYAEQAAALDNIEGMKILGCLFLEGKGVEMNEATAIKWLSMAADRNDYVSQYDLGLIYWLREDYQEAFHYFELAAINGFAPAQHKLGIMFYKGFGTSQDKSKAFKWYGLSANQGFSDSLFNLGMMYLDGEEVNQDQEIANQLIELAIKYGNLDALLFAHSQKNEIGILWNNKYIKSFDISKESTCDDQSIIFHYTSPIGLQSIISSESLRFSDCQYMNDKNEYTQIKEPLRIAAELMFSRIISENKDFESISDILSIFEAAIKDVLESSECIQSEASSTGKRLSFSDSQYYVFCSSESEDSLSMWNYYMKDDRYQGYNIGFVVKDLVKNFYNLGLEYNHIRLYYGHVFYDENEQIAMLEKLLINLCNFLIYLWRNKDGYMENNNYSDDEFRKRVYAIAFTRLNDGIENCRLFMKNNAFSDEREYRLVLRMPLAYEKNAKSQISSSCRMDHGIFIPYCDVKFDKKNTVAQITISPMVEYEIAAAGIFRYLNQQDFHVNTLSRSQIPVRY